MLPPTLAAEEVLHQLAQLSPEQRAQTFLAYVSRLLDSMDDKTLAGFRTIFSEGVSAGTTKQEVLDLIDGNRALRDLRRA
jgi:hypothetical protein